MKTWILKESVTISDNQGTISLMKGDVTLNIPDVFEIDLARLKSDREIVSANPQLLGKMIKKIHANGWLSLKIADGIHLENFQLEKITSPSNETTFVASSGIVTTRDNHFVLAFSPKDELIIRFDHKEYLSYLNLQLPLETSRWLAALGFYNHESNSIEIISEAFHLSTLTTDVSINKNYIPHEKWIGLTTQINPHDEFEKILLERKSVTSSDEAPSLEDLKAFLKMVYMPHDQNPVKFAYPSPGRMYSAQIRLVMPEGDVMTFNPITEEFTTLGKDSTLPLSNWIRIYIVGNTDELQKKYKNIPYRLLLLETGVLLHQLSIVTSAKGRKGYIVGMLEPYAKPSLVLEKKELVLAEYRLGK
jgi:hypothetical protein